MKSEIFEIPILICLFLTAIALFGDDLANSVYMILDFVGGVMIQIYVGADHWKLKVAASAIPEFFLQLKVEDLPERFTHTNHTREKVFETIQRTIIQDKLNISVETYRSKWPWSSVIGHAKPGKIFINSRKLESLHPADYVGNQAHELTHWPCLYRHDGNNPNKNRNLESVPYVIGSLAEAWFRGR